MSRPAADRRGFTLAELAVVVMIVGILAGLGLPNLRQAMFKAEASRLASEAHTVRLAAYDFLGDNGRFPNAGGYGTPPAELEPYLPENYEFTFNKVRFFWLSITFPNANNSFGTRNLGILLIDYSARPELALAMKANEGADGYWSATTFYYLMAG